MLRHVLSGLQSMLEKGASENFRQNPHVNLQNFQSRNLIFEIENGLQPHKSNVSHMRIRVSVGTEHSCPSEEFSLITLDDWAVTC